IVNVASTMGLMGFPGIPSYSASKGAVIALTRQVALDFAPEIRVNCVCPGPTKTERLPRGVPGGGVGEAVLVGELPRRRWAGARGRRPPLRSSFSPARTRRSSRGPHSSSTAGRRPTDGGGSLRAGPESVLAARGRRARARLLRGRRRRARGDDIRERLGDVGG